MNTHLDRDIERCGIGGLDRGYGAVLTTKQLVHGAIAAAFGYKPQEV
jgi:hypothetical protein